MLFNLGNNNIGPGGMIMMMRTNLNSITILI